MASIDDTSSKTAFMAINSTVIILFFILFLYNFGWLADVILVLFIWMILQLIFFIASTALYAQSNKTGRPVYLGLMITNLILLVLIIVGLGVVGYSLRTKDKNSSIA
jgi:hypothetical protein